MSGKVAFPNGSTSRTTRWVSCNALRPRIQSIGGLTTSSRLGLTFRRMPYKKTTPDALQEDHVTALNAQAILLPALPAKAGTWDNNSPRARSTVGTAHGASHLSLRSVFCNRILHLRLASALLGASGAFPLGPRYGDLGGLTSMDSASADS